MALENTAPNSVSALIDGAPFSRLQKMLVASCLVLCLIDGFNALSVGYVLPALAEDWHVNAGNLSGVVIASTIGEILAALLVAPLADRFGRRTLIRIGVGCIAVCTLATAFSQSVEMITILRFCTGLGVGAATPNIISLSSEYAPARARATVVTTIGLGLAGGGFVAGLVAGSLIPAFGWRSVFAVGGAVALVLLVATLALLPESITFLVARGRDRQVLGLLRRIAKDVPIGDDMRFSSDTPERRRVPIREILAGGRVWPTVLIWGVMFFGLLLNFFIYGYMPSVLTASGLSEQTAVFATSACTLGGMIGGVVLGVIVDRTRGGYRNLVFGQLLAIIATIVLVLAAGNSLLVTIFGFLIGFGAIGTQIGANAWAASLYPAAIRSTGVGWALGVGRVGGVLGPVIGGALLSLNMAGNTIFLLSLVPSVIVGCFALALARLRPKSRISPNTTEEVLQWQK
ncbi:MFS transporter [Amycolatopsis acidicola]|nr:MFS transporter [Amycolatopsis acidicola]